MTPCMAPCTAPCITARTARCRLLTHETGTNQDEMIVQFRLIDEDGSGQIDVIEFFKLIDVLHFHYDGPARWAHPPC